jgi:hypothetical protein
MFGLANGADADSKVIMIVLRADRYDKNVSIPWLGVNPILQFATYPSSSQDRESMHTSLCESELLSDTKKKGSSA